jgi:hypothetical protein
MWLVRINKEGHNYHVGYFTDEREAALAGNIKATTLFGEHVELNQLKLSEEQISIIKAKWDLKKQSPIKFRQPRRAKSSKYKGVHYDSERKQWIASITGKTGKTVFVGRYKTEQEAALAYNAKAAELFGEYASLNK